MAKNVSVKTVSVQSMTSVSPFCGVHTELYSHVEWGLFGWCLCPNLGIISHTVPGIVFAFFAFFLRCCAFCFAFFAFCGYMRFLLLSFVVEQLVTERDGGGEGVVVFGVGFEVKRKQACERGGWKEERGDRFLSGWRFRR